MASFDEHIKQAQRNFNFLQSINSDVSDCWDWQVTTAFYVAMHVVSAHLVAKLNSHYRSHEDMHNSINPYNTDSKCKFPIDAYIAYQKLRGLSRRARYLCNENFKNHDARAHLIFDKHFAKSVIHLDTLLLYMDSLYPGKVITKSIKVACNDLNGKEFIHFMIEKRSST